LRFLIAHSFKRPALLIARRASAVVATLASAGSHHRAVCIHALRLPLDDAADATFPALLKFISLFTISITSLSTDDFQPPTQFVAGISDECYRRHAVISKRSVCMLRARLIFCAISKFHHRYKRSPSRRRKSDGDATYRYILDEMPAPPAQAISLDD
jgi:hypothetical protein